jgi:hypothetical protein
MALYRLLRSNKESGPYSLNDLVTLGLKPYDLVWVDGRSAAWRYPSEVAELKEYAPVVEEQPYDRFYKKSSQTETAVKETTSQEEKLPRVEIVPQKIFVKETSIQEEPVKKIKTEIPNPSYSSYEETVAEKKPIKENIIKEEPVKKPVTEVPDHSHQQYRPQTKKQVFVSMPENNGFNQYQHEQYQEYLPKPKPVQEKQIPVEKPYSPAQEKYSPVQEKTYSSTQEKSYSPIDIHESDETKLETKYTQSLDDIKEMYINTLVQRKTRNRRKEIFRKYVRPALVPLFLVISGIAIGYVITYKKGSTQALQSVSKVVPQQNIPEQKNEEVPADDQSLQPDEKQNLAVVTNNKNRKPLNQHEQILIQPEKQNKNIQAISKAVVPERKEKEVFVPNDEVATFQKKDVQVDPTTGERTRTVRDNDEIVSKENNPRTNSERFNKKNNSEPAFIEESNHKNIRDFVSIRNNNYIRGAFGGIRGLELTVYNRSAFLLDEVSVELQIMKPSEQPLRTDVITVRNIAPNGAVVIKVPDSQRGIRADYRITNIESRQWQKSSTAGL